MEVLANLSNEELKQSLFELCSKERSIGVEILWYLNEVEERKLYLKDGYPSLFSFCTTKLKFSESQALRRVRVARLLREYPELEAPLREGEIKVCSLAEFWGLVSKENAVKLFAALRGKSRREAEVLAASLRPEDKKRKESITAIAVTRPATLSITASPMFTPKTSAVALQKSAPIIPTKSLHIRQQD